MCGSKKGKADMIWKIAKKEFLLNLMTFKFAVGTILCVVLMAVFMPVLVNDYQQRLKDYNANVAANEAEFGKVKVYKNITPTVYRPPNVLSVFSEGIDKQLESSEKIEIHGVSEAMMETSGLNPLLFVFPVLDVTLIFKIAVSVLAILMAYDVVSGERERGTLKLILSNTTARYEVLFGKLIAGLMTLIVPVTASFIVGLLILLTADMVSLTGLDWFRIALMYFASLIFISAMFNVGLLLSCLSKSSATSLVFGLFLWLLFAAIFPNVGAYIASQLKPIEWAGEFSGKIDAVIEKRDTEIEELTEDIEGGGSQSQAPGAFGHIYVMVCDESFMDYNQRRYTVMEPVMIKYIDKLEGVKKRHLNDLVRQKQLADNIAASSPIVLYENLMSGLAGTDLYNFECFKNNIKAYRNEVADYIRSKTENFTSTSYFTPCKEGDHEKLMKVFQEANQAEDEAERSKLMEAVWKRYKQMREETPSLDLQDFPKFVYRPQSITKTLQQVIGILGLLIFVNILFFSLSFVVFLKYDAR
jgi:ABC-type transport system involved in multi-copper enzyme maturation permease subunit